MLKRFLVMLTVFALPLFAIGCEVDNEPDTVGEHIEEAGEDVGDAFEEVGDKTEDAFDEMN